eukprot:CAMPEP_0174265932 /NCGR_PEP_ID=MMETSP0439-20130205/28475_1 /TAXON_ID=0 /ORGANISM="Stereomyxa ramosa, Strain Chinc5" /LENGTH=365 /DNA_ID=CAMNT_0015352631 /DNA_START=23 /DNA_END=1120 /DNA_ORIENTATION=+
MGDKQQLNDLCDKSFKEQAIWFMNAYWDEFASQEAENFWKYVETAKKVDVNGNGIIDELEGHRFLELLSEETTVMSLREGLRKTGAIGAQERPKTVPLTHYLLFKYGVDWHELITKPQGGDPEEIAKAEAMLREVMQALAASEERAAEARQAVIAAKQAVDAAERAVQASKQAEVFAQEKVEELRQREEELKIAAQELEDALAEVQAQEDAYNRRTEELKRKCSEGGIVSQGKAKNELAQHLSEDPLPLRKAKITAEAAVKKNERAIKAAADATVAAERATEEARQATIRSEEAKASAEEAKASAERAKAAADAAVEEAKAKVEETEAFVEEVKNSLPQGQVWWLERELHEARAYLPQKAGGYKK